MMSRPCLRFGQLWGLPHVPLHFWPCACALMRAEITSQFDFQAGSGGKALKSRLNI